MEIKFLPILKTINSYLKRYMKEVNQRAHDGYTLQLLLFLCVILIAIILLVSVLAAYIYFHKYNLMCPENDRFGCPSF